MKFFTVLFGLGLIISCSSEQEENISKKELHKEITKDDHINYLYGLSSEFHQDLNEMVNDLDSLKNPYMVQKENLTPLPCDKGHEHLDRILCVIQQFQEAKIPVHVGPTHEIPMSNNRELTDSVFIVDCIGDNQYFEEEERQYSYVNGKLLNTTDNYYLVLIAEEFSVGKDFILLTISKKTGKQIDQIILGGEFSDVESLFGKLTDSRHFEIDTKVFGYDEKNDLMYFKSESIKKYEITGDGVFKEVN